MRKKFLLFSVLIGLLGIIFFSGCASQKIPDPKGFVNDFANMIPDEQERALESFLVQYEKQTTNEVVVVTVESIGDKSIEDYTIRLAEKWKVGKKEKDNGVILLVAKKERKVRIEVGYGLEPVLTDAKAKLIIEKEIVPRFRAKDYSGGIQAGVNAVVAALEGSYSFNGSSPGSPESGGWPIWLIVLVIIGALFLFVLIVAAGSSGGGGGYWSSGGSSGGGGGGGFGGGSFGGGGASGGW